MARAVYAFNWYNVGAVLPLLGAAFAASTVQLGIVLAAFLAGAGIFQVPAGLASLRWGNRAIAIAALGVMGAFCTASAFSPNWWILALLRFGAGAGAAMFFAPALGLVASYYPAGSRGPMVGLFNSGFSLGSGLGLIAGAVVGSVYGWPAALLVGGVGLVASAVVAPLVLPRSEIAPGSVGPAVPRRVGRSILRSRSIWALAVSFIGLWSAFYVAAQYFVQYAHAAHPGWSLPLAAGLPTLMIAFEIPAGPLGGWLAERWGDMRWILVIFGIAAAGAIAWIPFAPLLVLVPLFALLGFLDGVIWAALYLLPTYLPETKDEGLSTGLGLLNAINIFGGSGLAVLFALVAASSGFTWAWLVAAGLAVLPLPLLALVRDHLPASPPPARLPTVS